MRPRIRVLLVGTLSLGCARAQPELRIDGSPGVAPLVQALAETYAREHSQAQISFGGGLGSRARIDSLAAGSIDVAMASHGVDTAALRARGIVAHEIARTAVVFAVNAGVDRRDITPAEVCDILSGRLVRWRDDLPIVPYARPGDEVDAEVATAAVPCPRAARAPSARVIDRADAMAAAIASTVGAFGVTSMPYVQQSTGRMRALALDGVEPTEANVASGRYPMTRRAILLVREPASPAVRRFLEFVRGEVARRTLRDNGAIPTS